MTRRVWQRGAAAIFLSMVAVMVGCARPPAQEGMASPGLDPGAVRAPLRAPNSAIQEAYGRIPLHFEESRDAHVRFVARGRGYALGLTRQEIVLRVHDETVRLTMLGARPDVGPEAFDALPGRANHLVGRDPSRWRTDVKTFAKVRYPEIYPGIDLVLYGNQRELEYDFVLAPGADPSRVRLRVDGATAVSLSPDGDVRITTSRGTIIQRKPFIYQEVDGAHVPVDGRYVVRGREIGVRVARYDRTRPLVIDPVLSYATLIGGSAGEIGYYVAADGTGNAYVVGSTESFDFPTKNPADPTNTAGSPQSNELFVAKFDPTGSTLVYATYLGGRWIELPGGIAVDASGSAVVGGVTQSDDFPIVNAYQSTSLADAPPEAWVGFLTKLNPAGNGFVYSTYLGSKTLHASGDMACAYTSIEGVALDATGAAWVAGTTRDPNFPVTPGAMQTTKSNDCNDAGFVTRFAPNGQSLLASTFVQGAASRSRAWPSIRRTTPTSSGARLPGRRHRSRSPPISHPAAVRRRGSGCSSSTRPRTTCRPPGSATRSTRSRWTRRGRRTSRGSSRPPVRHSRP
jgi:hypothetical protein